MTCWIFPQRKYWFLKAEERLGWSGVGNGESTGILFLSTLFIAVSLSDRMASISMSIRMALNPDFPASFFQVLGLKVAATMPSVLLIFVFLEVMCCFYSFSNYPESFMCILIYQCVILIYILCSFKVIQKTWNTFIVFSSFRLIGNYVRNFGLPPGIFFFFFLSLWEDSIHLNIL